MDPSGFTNAPLTDDEYDRLYELLDEHSAFGLDEVFGVFHAVAVSPSLVPPSTWLPRLLPDVSGLDDETGQELFGLLLRLHNEVLDALDNDEVMIPKPEDVEGCELFAAGYADGASLDPEWIGNSDRWTFASAVAYLGGRLDLVPDQTKKDIEANLPNPKEVLCRDLGAVVHAARDSFKKARNSELANRSHDPPPVQRVGRNAPCPCGSGKKYKRCCLNRASGVAS